MCRQASLQRYIFDEKQTACYGCIASLISNPGIWSTGSDQDRLLGPQRRLKLVMILGLLLLANAPREFEAGELLFSACLVGACEFARVDSVRESGAATPERCRHCARSGLATNQEKICSHSPSKGSLWVRRQPSTRFLRSCSWYKVSSPAAGSGILPVEGSNPVIQRSTEKAWMEAEGSDERKGKQPTAQRKTACCNCSSWCNKRTGSSACATSVSSCCFQAGKTPERSNRCNGVLAGS